jgi:hypothetical protein
MGADPRWLEILKASGWQTTALAVACAFLIYGNSKKWFSTPFEPWEMQLAEGALLVCGCLSVASIGSAIMKAPNGPTRKLARMWAIRRTKREVTKGIPQMNPKEREIVGYLLFKNQRMFTNTPDGGHANTLISKGIVVRALLPGQSFTYYEVPFEVPEHIWDVLVKHKVEFPHVPDEEKESEPHPWRGHWMSR